jgi:hypothetical protein
MKYLNFFDDEKALAYVVGSPIEDIDRLEKELGVKIPEALREYLQMMGVKPMDNEYYEQGTKDMKWLRASIYEDVEAYRSQGIELSEIGNILPFHFFLDTYFYVPVDYRNENPPVMAFDINVKPTVRKVADSVTDFVKIQYQRLQKELYREKG